MRTALTITDIALAALVGLLVLALMGIRVLIRLRQRRQGRLWPDATAAVARYVTTGASPPRPAGRAERAVMRDAAMQALLDLRGSERDLLVGLMGELSYLGDAEAALRAGRRAVRRRAAETLAIIATPAAAPALRAGLADRDPLVRTSCARTLARVGTQDDVPAITAVAQRDAATAPGAAAAVILALGRSHQAALGQLLSPQAPARLRVVAAAVAGRLRLPGLAPELRSCLHDGDELAAAAARGLGMIGDIEAVSDLRDVVRASGRAAGTRAAAMTALGSIGDAASVPVLEPELEAADWALRAAAAQGLAGLGEPGSWALRRAVRWGPPEAREQAEAVLPQ